MKQRSYFFYDVLDSTMLEYQRLQEVHSGLICVRAGTQADGVGRSDKAWFSPPGGLWFTFDFLYPELVASFGLYVGYCIHHALSKEFALLKGKLQIKWTNDIIYEGRKLGGLLCKHMGDKYYVGIGINTNNQIDCSLGKFGAVSMKEILGFDVSNEELCHTLIQAVENHRKVLAHDISYITYCNEHLFGRNCQAIIDVGTVPFEAEILGIDLHGALIVRKNMGEIVNIHSGSIMSVQAFA
jgi:biotin-[acetyl-CoA-carboxylase] ligase BirA-like protein